MIPAKSRERKCATCKHYQPSPLWRKGWCRNPLLYDRNTNHLVEAESLSCNRTFIDYWEPGDGSSPANGAPSRQGRGANKPRIAPSIPMDTVDAEGNRDVVTGHTPATGLPVTPGRTFYKPVSGRARPPLSIVTPEPEETFEPPSGGARVTRQIPKIDYPEDDDLDALTAQQRVEQPRVQSRRTTRAALPRLPISGPILWVVLAAVAALALLGGGFLLTRPQVDQPAVVAPTHTATSPAPTPTGFGDPTATSATRPTSTTGGGTTAVPTDKITVGGWVQVNSTNGLRVRQEPSTSAGVVERLPSGFKAHVVDGPRESGGYTWWKVDRFKKDDPTATGWCADDFLIPTTAPTP